MAKIKTADLTGPALNWAVAIADKLRFYDGWQGRWDDGQTDWFFDKGRSGKIIQRWFDSAASRAGCWRDADVYEPSTNPAQGQPILEREGICLKSENRDHSVWSAQFAYCRQVLRWPRAELVFSYCLQRGPTMLIAGLRCFVASKLGDEVEVPDELVNGG